VPDNKEANMIFSYGRHGTIDNKEPLCGDIIALRHATFGNYTPAELGHWYFDAHDTRYIRSNCGVFEGLVWLLSSDSDWLPEIFKNTFIKGIIARDNWVRYCNNYGNDFIDALLQKDRKKFKLNIKILSGLNDLIFQAVNKLALPDRPETISNALIDMGLINGYYDYCDRIKNFRGRSDRE
jgi:hypothetical protein